jgi:hypothetical protein
MAECVTWELLIAVDQVEQRHRFTAQGMDDVTIINHVAASTAIGPALWNAPTRQSQHKGAAKQAFQPLIIQADP